MLIVHLFVSYTHVNLCHFFSSSWCQGMAATSACALPGLFCLPFFLAVVNLAYVAQCFNIKSCQ